MLTPSRLVPLLIAAALALAGMLYAHNTRADGVSPRCIGCNSGGIASEGISGPGTTVSQPTGNILMVDGSSIILQTDGASNICRAGGC